jgi:hypothetical protein
MPLTKPACPVNPLLSFIILLSSILLLGCQRAGEYESTMTSQPESTTNAGIELTLTPELTITPTLASTPTLTSSVTPSEPEICSPLVGYAFLDLQKSIVNPYQPPPAGIDRPHQGVDFAILESGSNIALTGESVQAILSGEVSMIIVDRFPYGNAILIETPLRSGDDEQAYLDPMPTPWLQVNPDPALTCPPGEGQKGITEERSIYILYAHLFEPPGIAVGTALRCGETIGKIGMSGNALNPHVHIEARFGPSGTRFESMAHYDSSATPAEMAAYCQWRVSGIFQHFDPMILLQSLPASDPLINR